MAFIINGYNYLFEEIADPRVKDYFLMSSPLPIFCIVMIYLYFVLKLGPRLMQNRAPFDLERVLVVYNLIQIVACIYLIAQALKYTIFEFSYICEPVDYSDAEIPLYITRHVWMYFMLKLADLLDTVFFILRKKDNQVSFLHVYHHTGMCALGWVGTKYIAGGHGIFMGFLNCIVHVVMYFYYLLTAWDKEYKKNVWWKKYITQMQIVQFVILMVYFGQLFFQPNCNYPKIIPLFFVPQNMFMTILFTNFYIQNYSKPEKKRKIGNNSAATGNDLKSHIEKVE